MLRRIIHFLTRRPLKRLAVLAAISMVVWCGVICGLSALILSYGEDDRAQPADVIIVLGAGLRRDGRPGDALLRRSAWAARLYADDIAPAVICTGGVGRNQSRSEASACRDILLSRGVPDGAIHIEESSRSTEENAIYAGQIMDAQGWDTAVLVTDSFHMLRANWIFNIQDIVHVRSPVPREQVRSYHFVRHFMREIVALHWQGFKVLFDLPVTYVPF